LLSASSADLATDLPAATAAALTASVAKPFTAVASFDDLFFGFDFVVRSDFFGAPLIAFVMSRRPSLSDFKRLPRPLFRLSCFHG
jgi:hypothetical protein